MKKLTVKQAQQLKPGANVVLVDFSEKGKGGLHSFRGKYRSIMTKIVSKEDAKVRWGDEWREFDVWYWFKEDKNCYTMISKNHANGFCWKAVYTFKESERDKVKMMLDL